MFFSEILSLSNLNISDPADIPSFFPTSFIRQYLKENSEKQSLFCPFLSVYITVELCNVCSCLMVCYYAIYTSAH